MNSIILYCVILFIVNLIIFKYSKVASLGKVISLLNMFISISVLFYGIV